MGAVWGVMDAVMGRDRSAIGDSSDSNIIDVPLSGILLKDGDGQERSWAEKVRLEFEEDTGKEPVGYHGLKVEDRIYALYVRQSSIFRVVGLHWHPTFDAAMADWCQRFRLTDGEAQVC